MQRNVQSLTESAQKLKDLKERMLNVDPSSSDITASVRDFYRSDILHSYLILLSCSQRLTYTCLYN